jgi:phage gpG-like protein
MQNLTDRLQRIENFLRDGVYDVVGVEAENFYKESFRNEGFTDEQFEKWPEVKRRTNPGRSARTQTLAGRPILTGATGELGESIRYEKKPPHVVIHSDKEYARVHNEGGRAGRTGRQFDMKKRQFIGKSAQLNERITDKIKTFLKRI